MNGIKTSLAIDTNAAIAWLAGDAAVLEVIAAVEEVFVPSVALGELYAGAEKSAQAVQNVVTIDKFIIGRIVLPCDAETARWYGRIHQQLVRKGRPIPTNDIWIAALARQHELTLLTRDQHFDFVPDLVTLQW